MPSASAANFSIDQLRRQLMRTQLETTEQKVVGSGFNALDELLPNSGLSPGSVVEWIADAPGLRTTSIALKCVAPFLSMPGALAVVDPHHDFHAASISHLGIPLNRLLLVRPGRTRGGSSSDQLSQQHRNETLWALEQLARCSGVRVVLTWIDRLSSTAQRRLQLAVEKSGVTVFLIRPASALRQTSWADLQFHVQSETVCPPTDTKTSAPVTRVSLLRCRNAVQQHGHALMESHDETGDVSEISELARSEATTAAVD